MTALYDNDTSWSVVERLVNDPWKVFVDIEVAKATSLKGRFMLNSGEAQLTTALDEVDVTYEPIEPTLSTYAGATSQTIEGRSFSYPAGTIDARLAGLVVAMVAVSRKAPFPVVVVLAAAVTAAVRAIS